MLEHMQGWPTFARRPVKGVSSSGGLGVRLVREPGPLFVGVLKTAIVHTGVEFGTGLTLVAWAEKVVRASSSGSRTARQRNVATEMQVYRVRLGTAFVAAANDEELAAALALIEAAGGTDISVVRDQSNDRPRAEFAIEAVDRPSAVTTIDNLLISLTGATPSVAGGWVMTALVPATSQ